MHETPTRELPVVPATPGDADDRASVETLNRFVALVEAIRWHEAATSRPSVPRRPADHALYRTLDKLLWGRAEGAARFARPLAGPG
jgi:hypothetical protein